MTISELIREERKMFKDIQELFIKNYINVFINLDHKEKTFTFKVAKFQYSKLKRILEQHKFKTFKLTINGNDLDTIYSTLIKKDMQVKHSGYQPAIDTLNEIPPSGGSGVKLLN